MTPLIEISPNGHCETLLTDVLEGGVLNQEDQLAVALDGTIYIMKFHIKLKVFSFDFKLKYISDQCKEDDEERIKEKKESVEKDEAFR